MNRKSAIEWIVSNDTGISSKTMWYALMSDVHNANDKDLDKPYDADDFGRCYRFMKHSEATKSDFERIAAVFPFWKPYIENWEELENLYITRKFISLYEKLRELEFESDNIRKGGGS